ncbi:hypothetical protein BASA81_017449 [Batrachochytrium salamandrivorans]|nr:hypothetical protein BASA81_017449 [Batrachochytrium salamandrivorans]
MAPATAESKPPTPTESCGVCTDFKVLRRKRFPMVATTTQSTKNPSTPLAMGVAGVMGTAVLATADSPPTPDLDAVTVPSYSPMPCPPDSSELGASTWTFLHTMAAYYPESPSVEDKQAMRILCVWSCSVLSLLALRLAFARASENQPSYRRFKLDFE